MKTMNLRNLKGFTALALLLSLSSCSHLSHNTAPPPQAKAEVPALSWEQRQAKLEQLNHWKIKGAVAIRSQNDGGSVSLAWTQNQKAYTLSLFGPMGSNGVQITGQPGAVTLRTADGKQVSASNPEQLLLSQTGWNLPISSLYYWARGLPVPGQAAQKDYDQQHRLAHLKQLDWQIDYNQYASFQGLDLPTRLVLTHPTLHIKFVIYQWENVS